MSKEVSQSLSKIIKTVEKVVSKNPGVHLPKLVKKEEFEGLFPEGEALEPGKTYYVMLDSKQGKDDGYQDIAKRAVIDFGDGKRFSGSGNPNATQDLESMIPKEFDAKAVVTAIDPNKVSAPGYALLNKALSIGEGMDQKRSVGTAVNIDMKAIQDSDTSTIEKNKTHSQIIGRHSPDADMTTRVKLTKDKLIVTNTSYYPVYDEELTVVRFARVETTVNYQIEGQEIGEKPEVTALISFLSAE